MTDYSDLVKRLRFRMNLDDPQLAADAIEAQAARIAELEAALKEISRRTGILITQNQGRWTMKIGRAHV